MFGYIYETSCVIDDKRYVGKRQGKYNPNYLGSGVYLKNAIKKHGRNNFNKPIVLTYTESKKEQNECEKYFIAEYRKIFGDKGLYNLTDGGDGFSGKHTPKSREKIRLAGLGRIFTEETRKKISLSNLGKTMSKESNEKNRLAHLGEKNANFGKEKSIETKLKMRLAAIGKPKSAEHIQNMILAKSDLEFRNKMKLSRLGKKASPETKEKLRLSHLGKKQSAETIQKRRLTRRLTLLNKKLLKEIK